MAAGHVPELRIVHDRRAHAAEIFLCDHAGRNERSGMIRVGRGIDLHPKADRAPLTALRFVAVGREPAYGQSLRAFLEVARVRVLGRDLPRPERADSIGCENPPVSLTIGPPAQIGMGINRSRGRLLEESWRMQRAAPRVADGGSEHGEWSRGLSARSPTVRVSVESLSDLRKPRALVGAVLVGCLLLAVERDQVEVPLLVHRELLATPPTSASARSFVTFIAAFM